ARKDVVRYNVAAAAKPYDPKRGSKTHRVIVELAHDPAAQPIIIPLPVCLIAMLTNERTENSAELRRIKVVVSPDIFPAGVQVSEHIEITDSPVLYDGVILEENGVGCAELRSASPLPGVIIIAIVLGDIRAILKRVVIDYAIYAIAKIQHSHSTVKIAV